MYRILWVIPFVLLLGACPDGHDDDDTASDDDSAADDDVGDDDAGVDDADDDDGAEYPCGDTGGITLTMEGAPIGCEEEWVELGVAMIIRGGACKSKDCAGLREGGMVTLEPAFLKIDLDEIDCIPIRAEVDVIDHSSVGATQFVVIGASGDPLGEAYNTTVGSEEMLSADGGGSEIEALGVGACDSEILEIRIY